MWVIAAFVFEQEFKDVCAKVHAYIAPPVYTIFKLLLTAAEKADVQSLTEGCGSAKYLCLLFW